MPSYYDDNYGFYNIESEEDIAFYKETQRRSVRKKCQGCGGIFKLKPEYGYCNTCATKIENGWDIG